MKKIILFVLMACFAVPSMAQTYKVGDFYPDPNVNLDDADAVAKIEGIVFVVSEDGKHGTIFSLKEGKKLKWSLAGGADYSYDYDDGMSNFNTIRAQEPDFYSYPAFAWCASLGEGWYIPAINELLPLRSAWGTTHAKRRALNAKIEKAGGDPLKSFVFVESRGGNTSVYYYSSTECIEKRNKVYTLSFNSTSGPAEGLKKSSDTMENLLFRAVKQF